MKCRRTEVMQIMTGLFQGGIRKKFGRHKSKKFIRSDTRPPGFCGLHLFQKNMLATSYVHEKHRITLGRKQGPINGDRKFAFESNIAINVLAPYWISSSLSGCLNKTALTISSTTHITSTISSTTLILLTTLILILPCRF